jgi:hypothetical protein
MEKPWYKRKVKPSEWYKYKIVLETILEFLHRVPEEHFEWDKKHYCVKDYSLENFQFYICKKIDENSQDDTI